jgi:probable 2-oxoglutarate dehydrogenase E1 component DHKTD1
MFVSKFLYSLIHLISVRDPFQTHLASPLELTVAHVEAVNPVALGKTRAKQYALLKTSPADCKLGDRVMSVQLHGDASFSGQGVVMESLGLSE